MAYTKQTWTDNNSSFPLSAARMGVMETGIEAANKGPDSSTIYVSKNGSDSNDGYSWGSAKLTVAAALAALPQVSTKPCGKLSIGRGTFTETSVPMVVGDGVFIEGSGTGSSGAVPTIIKLGDSENTHLFQCTNTASQNHGLVFKDMILHGNKANQTGSADSNLIEFAGGYNVYALNLALQQSARWGIHMAGGYMNVQLMNITGAGCGSSTQGGFLSCDNTQSGGIFSLEGAQVDQCGAYPILIQYVNDGGGPFFRFADMKFEQQSGTDNLHLAVIKYVPRTSGVGNQISIIVENCAFINLTAATDAHAAAILETSTGFGLGAQWLIRNCSCWPAYSKLFSSDYTSRASWGRTVRFLLEQPETTTQPLLELAGCLLFAVTATPEASVTAPVGSLALNRSGSTSTTLYVKTSGTGNTGWTPK